MVVNGVKENDDLAPLDTYAVSGPVVVNVCGRNVTALTGAEPSVASLQVVLQKELSLNGQSFDIFDERGVSLTTDGDLRLAISRGATLAANLSEASVHYIENRREELSQLQWKLMRDQVSGVAEKLVQVGHRVQELSEAVTVMKHEHEESCRRMKFETETLLDSAKEAGKHDLMQLSERVDGLSHSVSSERNRREVAKENIDQTIQGLRDMIMADRSTRRSELVGTNSLLEEGRQALLEESRSREAIEARRTADVNWLSERVEALARSQAEKVQDLCEQVKTVALNVNSSLQDGTRSVLQVQSIAESTQIEASARLKKLEDRLLGIDSRIGEVGNREVLHYDDLMAKHRKVYSVIEDLRLEERQKGINTRRMQARVEEQEDIQKASPLTANFSTIMLDTEACGFPAAHAQALAAAASGSSTMPRASDDRLNRSVPHRGASARSPSPLLSFQPALAAQYGAPTSPQHSTVMPGGVPGSLPMTRRGVQQAGRGTAEALALGLAGTAGGAVAVPPQALRLAPRSVSPAPPYRGQVAQTASDPASLRNAAWTGVAQQQGGRLSVPRQRPLAGGL